MKMHLWGRQALAGMLLALLGGSASFGAIAMTSGHASTPAAAVATLPTSLTTDTNATLGGIDFFNAAGVQITTGSLSAPFAAFAVAQNAPGTAPTFAKMIENAYTPVIGQPPGNWSGSQLSHATTAYPVAAPTDLAGLPATTPVYSGVAKDKPLSTYIGDFPNSDTSTTDGYAGIYVIRIQEATTTDYAKAEIQINTAAGTWTQVGGSFPSPVSGSGPAATATTLSANPVSPVTAGTSVTFTATVSPTAPGNVQFMDGGTALGSAVPVSGANATFTTSTLPAGTHPITAVFTPNDSAAFSPSTSTALSYVVNASGAAATSTAIASNPGGPVTSGTSVIFTATVTPSTAPGSVQFMDGATTLGSPVAVTSGAATLTTSSLSVNTHSITAVFTSSTPSAFGSSTSLPLSFQVTASTGSGPTATVTTLAATPPSPTTAGTATTFTATVTPSAAGNVQFMDGTTTLGSPVAVTTGTDTATAAFAPATLLAGTHPITAVFTPTTPSAFSTSTSDALSYVVNAAGSGPTATTTLLTSSTPSPTTAGTATTFTATVTPSAAGSVQFMDGTTTLGSPVTVTTGTTSATAASAPQTLSTGTHPITAVFTPTTPTAFTTSTSSSYSFVVNAAGTPATTATTVTSSVASPTTTGTSVTFTATVAPSTAIGTVQFMNGTTAMGSPVAVSSGTATYTTAFGAAATYPIMASFTPTTPTAFSASTSTPALSFVVTGATVTSTALAVSPATTAAAGASVQLTATVTPATAIGSVVFYDGSTTLGTQTLASGSAVLSTSTLGEGSTHSFVAIFTPTNSTATDPTAFKGSQSPAVPYTITAADTTTPTLTGPDGATLPTNPTLTPGEVVTVQAGGFGAGESVTVVVHSTPMTLTPTAATSTGTLTYAFTVPSDLATGPHSLVLTGATSQKTVTINFSVAAATVLGTTTSTPSVSSGSLPFTGYNIELLAVFAIACTGVGIAIRTRGRQPQYTGAHEWRRRH